MNILINDYCNLKCPYCFAENVMEAARHNPERSISIENFKLILEFLAASDQKTVRILGGEPTLHPNFKELINLVIEDTRFDSIMLFSNATFNAEMLDFIIESSKRKRINMLPNCNEKHIIGDEAYETMTHNVKELSKHGIAKSVGINIYHQQMDTSYIFELANQANVPHIRWSITVPNKALEPGFDTIQHFKTYHDLLVNFFDKAIQYNKTTGVDCNTMPLCAIEADLYKLIKMSAPSEIKRTVCSNIFDVKPNLNVIRCFGMSDELEVNLKDFKNDAELEDLFNHHFEPIQQKPLVSKCQSCNVYKKSGNKACSCLQYRKQV